jgi:hypothetical protein
MKLFIPANLATAIDKTRNKLSNLESQASAHILSQLGFAVGDRVEDTSTGLHYIVKSAHGAWTKDLGANAYVYAYRIYKSGRREGRTAGSWSSLSPHWLVKVEAKA